MFRLKVLAMVAITSIFGVGCLPQESSSVEAKSAPVKAIKKSPEPKAGAKTAPATEKKSGAADTKTGSDARVVKGWDFTQLSEDAWTDFFFPGNVKIKGENGALFTVYVSEIGPQILNLGLDASQVASVRLDLTVQRHKEGKDLTPVKLTGVKAFWVGPDEIKEDWPQYAEARSVKMEQHNSANPNEWTASLKSTPAWKGKVVRLAFRLDVPEQLKVRGNEGYLVAIKKIDLLK